MSSDSGAVAPSSPSSNFSSDGERRAAGDNIDAGESTVAGMFPAAALETVRTGLQNERATFFCSEINQCLDATETALASGDRTIEDDMSFFIVEVLPELIKRVLTEAPLREWQSYPRDVLSWCTSVVKIACVMLDRFASSTTHSTDMRVDEHVVQLVQCLHFVFEHFPEFLRTHKPESLGQDGEAGQRDGDMEDDEEDEDEEDDDAQEDVGWIGKLVKTVVTNKGVESLCQIFREVATLLQDYDFVENLAHAAGLIVMLAFRERIDMKPLGEVMRHLLEGIMEDPPEAWRCSIPVSGPLIDSAYRILWGVEGGAVAEQVVGKYQQHIVADQLKNGTFTTRLTAVTALGEIIVRANKNSENNALERVKEWMKDKDIVNLMLSAHVEKTHYAEQVLSVLRHMASKNIIQNNHIEALWVLIEPEGTFEGLKENVLLILATLAEDLSDAQVVFMVDRGFKVPRRDLSDARRLMSFAHRLALHMDMEVKHVDLLMNFQWSVLVDFAHMDDGEMWHFFSRCMARYADLQRRYLPEQYFKRVVKELKEGKITVAMLHLCMELFRMHHHINPQQDLCVNLLDLFVFALQRYHSQLLQESHSGGSAQSPSPCPNYDVKITHEFLLSIQAVASWTHTAGLKIELAQRIWDMLVLQPACPAERREALKWFIKLALERTQMILLESTAEALLVGRICELDPNDLDTVGFQCFHAYFCKVSIWRPGSSQLPGVDFLWQLLLNNCNPEVAEGAQELIAHLYIRSSEAQGEFARHTMAHLKKAVCLLGGDGKEDISCCEALKCLSSCAGCPQFEGKGGRQIIRCLQALNFVLSNFQRMQGFDSLCQEFAESEDLNSILLYLADCPHPAHDVACSVLDNLPVHSTIMQSVQTAVANGDILKLRTVLDQNLHADVGEGHWLPEKTRYAIQALMDVLYPVSGNEEADIVPNANACLSFLLDVLSKVNTERIWRGGQLAKCQRRLHVVATKLVGHLCAQIKPFTQTTPQQQQQQQQQQGPPSPEAGSQNGTVNHTNAVHEIPPHSANSKLKASPTDQPNSGDRMQCIQEGVELSSKDKESSAMDVSHQKVSGQCSSMDQEVAGDGPGVMKGSVQMDQEVNLMDHQDQGEMEGDGPANGNKDQRTSVDSQQESSPNHVAVNFSACSSSCDAESTHKKPKSSDKHMTDIRESDASTAPAPTPTNNPNSKSQQSDMEKPLKAEESVPCELLKKVLGYYVLVVHQAGQGWGCSEFGDQTDVLLVEGTVELLEQLVCQWEPILNVMIESTGVEEMMVSDLLSPVPKIRCSLVQFATNIARKSPNVEKWLFQLLKKHRLVADQHTRHCREFYTLLQGFVQMFRKCTRIDEVKDADALLQEVLQSVRAQPYEENPEGQRLECQLRLLAALVKALETEAVGGGADQEGELVRFLINDLLFPETCMVRRINDSGAGLPTHADLYAVLKTKTTPLATREAAFDLLLELMKISSVNHKLVRELIWDLHFNPEGPGQKDVLGQVTRAANSYVGLQNAGATCYMNAVLQQLFMQPAIQKGILSASVAYDQENGMFNSFQRLFGNLRISDRKSYSPRGFIENYTHSNGQRVDVRQHHDALEFFQRTQELIDDYLTTHGMKTVIQNAIGGSFAQQIICRDGDEVYISETQQPYTEVTVDVLGKTNLQESLEAYVQGERLEGENAYYCAQWGKKVAALKRNCIKTLPQTLVVHLKRFELDYEVMETFKIQDRFEFPVELDVFPYTSAGLLQKEGISKAEGSNDDPQSQLTPSECTYHLKGIVVHKGEIDGGHYYSFVKERPVGGKCLDDCQWWRFDDSCVEPWDIGRIDDDCFGGIVSDCDLQNERNGTDMTDEHPRPRANNAYLLIYEQAVSGAQDGMTDFASEPDYLDPQQQVIVGPPPKIAYEIMEENIQLLSSTRLADTGFMHFMQNLLHLMPNASVSDRRKMRRVTPPASKSGSGSSSGSEQGSDGSVERATEESGSGCERREDNSVDLASEIANIVFEYLLRVVFTPGLFSEADYESWRSVLSVIDESNIAYRIALDKLGKYPSRVARCLAPQGMEPSKEFAFHFAKAVVKQGRKPHGQLSRCGHLETSPIYQLGNGLVDYFETRTNLGMDFMRYFDVVSCCVNITLACGDRHLWNRAIHVLFSISTRLARMMWQRRFIFVAKLEQVNKILVKLIHRGSQMLEDSGQPPYQIPQEVRDKLAENPDFLRGFMYPSMLCNESLVDFLICVSWNYDRPSAQLLDALLEVFEEDPDRFFASDQSFESTVDSIVRLVNMDDNFLGQRANYFLFRPKEKVDTVWGMIFSVYSHEHRWKLLYVLMKICQEIESLVDVEKTIRARDWSKLVGWMCKDLGTPFPNDTYLNKQEIYEWARQWDDR